MYIRCASGVFGKLCFRVAIQNQADASIGRVGGFRFFKWILSFEQPWVYEMIPLGWDPDRYDYLSDHYFFLATWSLWDLSEREAFVEVSLFSFLTIGELQLVCCTCYGLYLDSEDILLRLDDYRRAERAARA